MKITPLDIQKKTFRTIFRGLDPDEVRAFLELVAGELEELLKEDIALKEELRRKNGRLEEYKEREKVLQETLVTAQKITEDIKDQARKEAGLVRAEAEKQADKIVHDAQERVVELVQQIAELKRQRARFEVELRKTVESHLSLLDALGGGEEDNVEFFTPRRAAGEGDPAGDD